MTAGPQAGSGSTGDQAEHFQRKSAHRSAAFRRRRAAGWRRVIAKTPEPPYYAVIFTSTRTTGDNGYAETAERMFELAARQPGFLGVESAREGLGITVSYWRDLESMNRWRNDLEHREAQRRGRELWYSAYRVRVARVDRDYGK